jgi:prolyl-tRNA synthetase
VAGRDFTPDGIIEAAEVRAGDPCPACGDGALTIRRGVEIAHIFQLGRHYTDAFQVDVLGVDGKPVRPTMGSYGIGITRAVAVIAEQHHDERGLLWPDEVAPADVHVVAAGKDGQVEAALELAASLEAAGLRVLVDDRPNLSAGVKFTDAELIGIPRAIVVGRRFTEGYAEVRDRRSGERRDVPLTDVTRVMTEGSG